MTGMFAPAFSYLNCRYSPTNLARDVPAEGSFGATTASEPTGTIIRTSMISSSDSAC